MIKIDKIKSKQWILLWKGNTLLLLYVYISFSFCLYHLGNDKVENVVYG